MTKLIYTDCGTVELENLMIGLNIVYADAKRENPHKVNTAIRQHCRALLKTVKQDTSVVILRSIINAQLCTVKLDECNAVYQAARNGEFDITVTPVSN